MLILFRIRNCLLKNFAKHAIRSYTTPMQPVFTSDTKVLGIETSCDDTGCTVVDGTGTILGEALYSQTATHVRYGGVNPVVAQDLHRENIEPAHKDACRRASLTTEDIDAIAVTTKPGLLISLQVGVMFAKHLARQYKKPLIPVHHMEGHALIARMYQNIPFPYLVLLISGGDCIIAVARDVSDYLLLGQTLDNAPGEIMDKAARRMKLQNIPAYSRIPGGQAIELAAANAKNPERFNFPLPLVRSRDCNFSFSGLKDSLVRKLIKKEDEHGVMGNELIPEVYDLCSAFQLAIAEHLIHRTERAIIFCEKKGLIPDECKNIVVSGGVACNNFIFKSLTFLGDKMGYHVHRPPPKVCTDNGVMIAWNGIEKLKKKQGVVLTISLQDIEPDAPFGKNISREVAAAGLQTRVTRLKNLCVS